MFLVVHQKLLDLAQNLIFVLECFVSTATILPLNLIINLLEVLDVLQSQLLVDDVQVSHRVHVALHVGDVGILECSAEVKQRVASLDVAEESVAQALALTGALHQTSDVGDVEEGGHLAGGLVVLHQPVEPGNNISVKTISVKIL